MGSTSTYRAPGQTDREFWQGELSKGSKILDCATIRLPAGGGDCWTSVFYAAVQQPDDATYAPGETWALVALQWRGRGDYNFTYKDMSETMGPCEAECPTRILDLLTPTDSEWANEWRERCRSAAERKASVPKVKKGDRIRFVEPIAFTSGVELTELVFVERSTFTADGCRYRIPRWKDRKFEVVA